MNASRFCENPQNATDTVRFADLQSEFGLLPTRRLQFTETAMTTFTKVVLYTDSHGRSQFREERVELSEGTPQAMLSRLQPSSGYQLRHSPIGFRSDFHCTTTPQFVFILSGEMEIGLQDGTSRTFKA